MQSTLESIETFVLEVCAGKENETPAAYRGKLRRLERWLLDQNKCLCQLEPDDIQAFKRSLYEQKVKRRGSKIVDGKLSPFTVHTVLSTVKHFLHWSYLKRITKSDLSQFKIPSPPAPDPKAIEAGTVLKLLEAASHTGAPWEQARNLAFIYVLRDTGGRIGALINADIDNLDLRAGKLYVMEKGNKPHNLYLNAPTISALREWLRYRPELKPQDCKLFLSYRGKGLQRSSVYSLIERIKHHADQVIQGRTNPHAYRHAWARDALSAGEDLSKVAETLGHSTIRVTAEYYARWSDRELKQAHRQYSPGATLPIIKPKIEHL